ASPELMHVLAKAHQFLTFTTPPNLQVAVAHGLSKDDAYFTNMRAEFQAARDHFTSGLVRLGFDPLPAQPTSFVNVDLAPPGIHEDDRSFAQRLVTEGGVATIPVSAFYDRGAVSSVIRFCFAKRRETLDAALERLERFLKGQPSARRRRSP